MTRPADRTPAVAEMVAEVREAHAGRTRRVEANEVRMRETVAERHAPALCDAVERKDALLAHALQVLSTHETFRALAITERVLLNALRAELEGK